VRRWTDSSHQEFLIAQGHEAEMVSRNNDLETPLMLAAAAGKEDMGVTLAKRFPECIPWQDKTGLDAVRTPSPLFPHDLADACGS
jgi:hypothetical protein